MIKRAFVKLSWKNIQCKVGHEGRSKQRGVFKSSLSSPERGEELEGSW